MLYVSMSDVFLVYYQNQNGWAEVLNRFIKGGGRILDVEYMTDECGK